MVKRKGSIGNSLLHSDVLFRFFKKGPTEPMPTNFKAR